VVVVGDHPVVRRVGPTAVPVLFHADHESRARRTLRDVRKTLPDAELRKVED
jgi:hypothetical protein